MTPIRFPSGGTLRDVAETARVSTSTASRVLNGGKPVSAELAKRVQAAAKRVGYTPHRVAQALRGRSNLIVMLVDDPTTPSMAETVTAMQAEAKSIGAVVTVAASGSDSRQQLTCVRTLTALRPRAVVLSGAWLYDPELADGLRTELDEYEHHGGHVVVIGQSQLPHPALRYDDHAMGLQMAEHVAALARRPVLILTGPVNHPALAARTRGFQEGLLAAGMAAADIHLEHSRLNRDEAAAAVARRWETTKPSAIMAANDVLALGALAELHRRGIRVPDDVILTGIDDIPGARHVDPALTTITLPFDEVGRTALRLALEPTMSPDNMVFTGRLIRRTSTGG